MASGRNAMRMATAVRGRHRSRRTALALLIGAVGSGIVPAAHGHTLLARSDPAPGMVVLADQPARHISLWFTGPVTVGPNAVVLLDSQNRRVGASTARVAAEDPARVDLEPGALSPGAYAIRWRVTSADNHVVRGTYWFIVAFAAAPPPAASLLGSRPPPVSTLETVARWLGLLATLALAGAPFFQLLVLGPAMRRLSGRLDPDLVSRTRGARPAPFLMAGVFLLAQILGAAAQAQALAELPLLQALGPDTLRVVFLGSRFAALWWARLLLVMILAGLLARSSWNGVAIPRWPAVNCPAAVGLLLLFCTALGGHAVDGRAPLTLALTVDTLHLAAAALWVGGLLSLAFWLARTRLGFDAAILAAIVPRFSAVALASVLVLLASGGVNAYVQIASLRSLVHSAYGQSLLLKLALLVPLLGLAAINRWVVRPAIAGGRAGPDSRWPHRFRDLVRAELGLAVAVLLVVGLLGSLPPPGATPLPSPAVVVRPAGPLRAELRIDPNWVGVSRFRVTLRDAQGLPPADIRHVIMTFTMEGMNMGRTHVTLASRGAGVYEAEGFYVGMPGVSQIGVGISRREAADQSTVFRIEVPDVNATQLVGLRGVLSASGPFAPPRPPNATRGREIYARQCAVCHGDRGIGDGPAAPSLLPPPADLTLHARWHADEQLAWFITHGVAGTSMVGFGDRLDPDERWDVIAHLRVLAGTPSAAAARRAPAAPLPAPPPPRVTAAPPPTSAAAPITPASASASMTGRLVFGPDFDNNLSVLTLPDGKPVTLTRLGPLEFSSNPAWSPDGRRVAFSYYRLPGGEGIPVPDGTDLHLMNADGSAVRPLAVHDAPGAALQYPAWSPDGTAVYASSVRPGGAEFGIDRIDVTSRTRARVVPQASFPSPSRDGRRLAYVRFATAPDRGQSLWWSRPDGSGPQAIVAGGVFDKLFAVRFAPDGQRLLFAAVGRLAGPSPPAVSRLDPLGLLARGLRPPAAFANGDLWELWIVDLDGRNLRPLTTLGEDLPVGAWSPDGTHVAFLGGGSASSAEAGLAVIRADGSGLRRLTTQPGHRGLDWAPAAAR